MARTIDEFGNESGSIAERKEKKRQQLAMDPDLKGQRSNIKYDPFMKQFMPDLGAGRLNDKKIRFKNQIPRA
tara:strand:- start:43 stop:258 length:216 start_codon:yes stop_codon:yes gene_type:complete